ncbi:hypothetical protein D0868_04011 [Hortaea werneckii]|uniref:Uncharacterized protein n=1 Tax=Hortaea werneckii TaxID=91943 RepID=A0A3M6Z3Z7_HORWE|nr:hypothetical protein D0868_04011 [Hortaea werneckii]
MNYANMIEEKHLKKGFIVATLISTIVGTLTTSMTLHDKVQEKRDKKKQKALDAKQTGEIEKLRKRVDALKSGNESDDETESTGSRSKSRNRRPRRRSLEEDDFVYESRRSRAMIERMYEDHLMRAGDRYATGDIMTENRLQKQLIQLQQTVINVLQDALYSGRGLTETDQRRLITAQSAARDGSLDALEDHYARISTRQRREILPNDTTQRLLPPAPSISNEEPSTHYLPPNPSPAPTTALRPYRPPHSIRSYSPDPALFCPYSIHLQTTIQPLSPSPPTTATEPTETFLTCPTCHSSIPVSARDYWILSTTGTATSSTHPHQPVFETGVYEEDDDFIPLPLPLPLPTPADLPTSERQRQGRREWKLTARFLVKSHTPEGEFACLFCEREGRRVDVATLTLQCERHTSLLEKEGVYSNLGLARVSKGLTLTTTPTTITTLEQQQQQQQQQHI